MAADKQIHKYARQLFKLSFANGQISPERVTAVLAILEKNPPRHPLSVLKSYYSLIRLELAKGQAVVEHAGSITSAALDAITAALSKTYSRPVTAVAKPNAALIAGLRVRVGDDLYESSIAGQLEALAANV
ncbi:MAG TPA: F0F1 ATP synthase subunit delta [Opitutaceae bacterium]|nr:F0F1 ATP synthase subunit delta [Opitutaceae bacterium]